MVSISHIKIVRALTILGFCLSVSFAADEEDPVFGKMDEKVLNTLTEGVYSFDPDGFIPTKPLEQMQLAHIEILRLILGTTDANKQADQLITILSKLHKDLGQVRLRLKELFNTDTPNELNKSKVKADAFVLMTGHTMLISRCVLQFHRHLKSLLKRNQEFKSNVQWAFDFVTGKKLARDTRISRQIDLAKQELEWIPRSSNFKNPYLVKQEIQEEQIKSTTTKRPRKKLKRGPRLSGGEL